MEVLFLSARRRIFFPSAPSTGDRARISR